MSPSLLLCLRSCSGANFSLSLGSLRPDSTFGTTFFLPSYTPYVSTIPSNPPDSSNLPFSLQLFPVLLSLNLSEPVCLKIKLSQNLEVKPLIFSTPWTKAELRAIDKDFPKVPKNLTDFLRSLIQSLEFIKLVSPTYISQFICLLGEGQAQHCIKATNWGSLERSQGLQLRAQPSNFVYSQAQAIAREPHQAIPRVFPKSVNKQNSGMYTKI